MNMMVSLIGKKVKSFLGVSALLLGEYLNSQFAFTQELGFLLRLIAACFCGACIGIERSRRFKEAGIRTHIIVCCAAALMMIVSKYGFADLTNPSGKFFSGTRGADPARIAAQVVSGISFLGAGVIYKNGSTVKGLTTAAGIWATAGIGLAIGAGMYWVGLFSTLIISVFQITMHRFKIGADSYMTNRFAVTAKDSEEFRAALYAQLKAWDAQITDTYISRRDDGTISYDLTLKMTRPLGMDDVRSFMEEHSEVYSTTGTPIA